MASKFLITVFTPKNPHRPPRVRGHDDLLDESTEWIQAGMEFRGQPDALILASVCDRGSDIRKLLETAAKVGYMVCLNDDHRFDVQDFLRKRESMLQQFRLDRRLDGCRSRAIPSRARF